MDLSVVIPVFNEEECLPILFERLWRVLEATGKSFEILFVNDGSRDGSLDLMRSFFQAHPQNVRILDLNRNYGQYRAILAGFEFVRGDVTVMLDADLQNPPEEIPLILSAIEAGHDFVGSYRKERDDHWFRRWGSKMSNWVRRHTTDVGLRDQGCMLCAFQKRIIDTMVQCAERYTFIPVLAWQLANNPSEVGVEHCARAVGTSKYSFAKLVRLYFDLLTSFTTIPLQLFTWTGAAATAASGLYFVYELIWNHEHPQAIALAVLLGLVSFGITGIGVLGEYIGRIYHAVLRRPRFLVRELIES